MIFIRFVYPKGNARDGLKKTKTKSKKRKIDTSRNAKCARTKRIAPQAGRLRLFSTLASVTVRPSPVSARNCNVRPRHEPGTPVIVSVTVAVSTYHSVPVELRCSPRAIDTGCQ